MTSLSRQARRHFRCLASGLGESYAITAQADGYEITDIEPGEVEYTDADWDGGDAESSYPNPSNEDTDLDFLADHYLFVPQNLTEGDRPSKSEFKGPIRMGPGGPVNTNALLANIQALNGARGGFDGISMETMQAGFEAAVDHLVAAGFYSDADEAPDMDIEASLTAEYTFSVGSTATWAEDSDNQAYGIVRDRTQEGEDNFADRIDGDFALDATEENPAYLLEILDQTDDGWVPTGTMVGHRQDTLSTWSPEADVLDDQEAERFASLAAHATGNVTADGSVTLSLSAESDSADGSLGGIIWGAGDHDLALGGEPTPVRVPPDTIPATFEALKEDVASGDVTLGFDHPGPDSVAAKTGIVDIGRANEVALTADEQFIVLTDSELENDQAAEAAQQGEFDDLDWSVVADVAVQRDENGDPITGDGRIKIGATRIRRIDAVQNGAVNEASIERSAASLPDLKDETQTVQQAAADLNQTNQAIQALSASATAITETMDNKTFDPSVDDDIPDEVAEQLSAASDIIDEQQDELEAAQAKASGFEAMLSAHDVDADDFEDPQAAAQAVIDEQTAQTRQEIAEIEAELGKYDTDDVEARASDLAGTDPDDLRQTLNARKAEAYDRQQKAQNKGRAVASGDSSGRVQPVGGDGASGDADADDIALSAMDGSDRIQAEAQGMSPSEYVNSEYGLTASEFDAADELHDAILDEIGGDA